MAESCKWGDGLMAGAKQDRFNLTDGGILNKLLMVSLPVIGTQIIQMTYNLADMFWLGRVGSDAVAASGTVGMYLWLSMAFFLVGARGAEIGVSQNTGKGDLAAAREIGQTCFTLSAIIGVAVAALFMLLRSPLLSFFALQEASVVADAEDYMLWVSIGLPFNFIGAACTGVFNGRGNTRAPFMVNSIGLAVNMALDPLLIFGFGMGVRGAAVATSVAQIVTGLCLVLLLVKGKNRPFEHFRLFAKPQGAHVRRVLKWTIPMSIESFLFTFLSMTISRLIAGWGAGAIAAQRVGSQIESLSWLVAGGYSTALTAFTGQNFGAGKWSRIRAGFAISARVMSVYGVLITGILFFGARGIFAIFLPGEPDVALIGVDYLRILSVTQFIACFEAIASGAFRGLGRTAPPSIVSASANAARVVAAYFLCRTALGLSGIWWAISLGSAVRGLWMTIWYITAARKHPRDDAPDAITAARQE
jgi:putative MATE family efflux protein